MKKYQEMTPTILVLGDLMIDYYLWGETKRISPEAPVPVVDIKSQSQTLGGAGNVINNLIALGANVKVSSVLGDDTIGKELLQMLRDLGINDNSIVIQKGRLSTKKSRVIASHQQVIRFDSETKENISKKSEDEIIQKVKEILPRVDAILISDYAKGVLTKRVLQEVITQAKMLSKPLLVDPKGQDYIKYKGATLITPNKKEATEATGIEIVDDETLRKAGFMLRESLDLDYTIITLSEDGIAIFDDSTMTKIPTVAREVYDVTGAGDSVLSTIGFVLACDGNIKEACEIANASAAVVVGKLGSATATWDEILEYRHKKDKNKKRGLINKKNLKNLVDSLKKQNKKIVFTNGCFDILHLGHVKYLEEAKNFGDILIVGVNSDESVRRLKGSTRPINPEFDRAYILSSLDMVDYVVIFEEDTPYNLIKIVEPDILVKGGDYRGKKVVGSDIAKEVRLVDFVDGKSTTSIIERAKSK